MFTHLLFVVGSFWDGCLKGDLPTGGDIATLACIPSLFKQLLNYALFFAGFTALVFIIIGGIRYITSGGDPKQAGAAKQIITYAIIGLVLILLSIGIVNFIAYITGAECIKNFGFDTCQ
jgi:hypothetical protein